MMQNVIVDHVTGESLQDNVALGMGLALPIGSFRYEATTETGLSSVGATVVDELRGQTPEEWRQTRPLK